MKRGIVFLAIILSLGVGAHALTTVEMGAIPAYVNPGNGGIDISFTVMNVDLNSTDQLKLVMWAGNDGTLANATALSTRLLANDLCGNPSDYITPRPCTYTWDAIPNGLNDGNVTFFIEAFFQGASDGVDFGETVLDTISPILPTPTLIPDPSAGGWMNSPIQLTATCTDTSSCTLHYAIELGAYISFPGTIALENVDGLLLVKAMDAAGNETEWVGPAVQVDTLKPTLTLTSSPSIPTHGYTTQTQFTFTIDVDDVLSGIDDLSFVLTLDGTATNSTLQGNQAIFTPSSPLGEGSHSLVALVKDLAGNEETKTFPFTIDTTTPTLTLSVAEFTNDPTPSFTLSASDAGGIDKLYMRCGTSGNFTEMTHNVNIDSFSILSNGCSSGEGSRTIETYVSDRAGNVSPTQTKNVYYDVTPPGKVNDLELDSVDDEAIDLEWDSGSDSGSGIKEYEVYRSTSSSIPDSSSRTTSGTSTSITGLDECTTYYFWVKAIDKAGNKGNASDRLEAKTSGCASSSNNNNTNNDSSNNSGGSLPACAVTFDVETPWYAGDSIVVEVESSQSYTGGELSSFATGKLTQNHGKTNLSQRAWGATIPIPLEIGNTFTLKFTADQCSAAVKTGIILDPAARTAAPVSEPAPPVESVSHEEVLMSIDSGMLPLILQEAGFNPEDQDTLAETTQLMDEWNVSKFIQIIPSPTETGKYVLKIIYRLESNGHSTIRLIENVPKAMANFTSELTSEHGFTTLKDDPIIQFEALDLREGEAVEFSYQTIASFTQEEAEFLAAQLSARTSPPILQGELNDDQPSLFSGLVSAASGMAMPIIGILVIAGIILMGRRMIPTDTRGMDNPILWSSARSDRMHGKPIVPSRFEPTPFRTVKWKR